MVIRSRANCVISFAAAAATTALLFSSTAFADDELSINIGGRVQSDLRFRTEKKGFGDYYDRVELPEGPERNWNTLSVKADASYGRFKAVAQLDFTLDGFSTDIQGVSDLYRIEKVEPYWFQAQSLYIDAKSIFFDGLDLRIGQQVVSWGVGDQFNPTNTLNPDDLRDPLLFGKQAGNFMVKADYWLNDDWSISGVMVPVFQPALLPRSAALAPSAIDRVPFVDPVIRQRVEAETAASKTTILNTPTVIGSATPVLPEVNFENMQWAYRIAGTLAEQDIALSYYYGRNDFPVPIANHTRLDKGERCDPNDKTKCVSGLLRTDATLAYPKMHVYGLNASGEIPLSWIKDTLHGIGYRFEAGLFVPDEVEITLTQDALDLAIPQPAGEYDYDNDGKEGGPRPLVVERQPFLKWVVGLDYTFGEHVYVNAQWVHGLVDEYGAGDFFHEGWTVRQSGATSDEGDTVFKCALLRNGETCSRELLHPRIGDYIVLGFDFKLMNNALLLRLFNILDVSGIIEDKWDETLEKRVRIHHSPFSEEGFSMVIFPEVNYNFGNGLDLGAGALFQLGKDYTKFGDPAAGGSTVWTRGKFSF
ncbi:MAG: hypothetical protein IPK82_13155 [Polyangiaceae bacterium]|nr:hypothetical protein [Polyangiaceae bacterium]